MAHSAGVLANTPEDLGLVPKAHIANRLQHWSLHYTYYMVHALHIHTQKRPNKMALGLQMHATMPGSYTLEI